MTASGNGHPGKGDVELDCKIATSAGNLFVNGTARGLAKGRGILKGEVTAEALDLNRLLRNTRLGKTTADIIFDAQLKGRDVEGKAEAYVSQFQLDGNSFDGISAEVEKAGKDINGEIKVSNEMADADISADVHLEGEESWYNLLAKINYFHPSMAGLMPAYKDYTLSGALSAQLEGNDYDNLLGEVRLTDVNFFAPEQKSIALDRLVMKSAEVGDGRQVTLRSDWIDGEVKGNFKVKDLAGELMCMVSNALPSLVKCPVKEPEFRSDMEFSLNVKADNTLTEFFNLPVRLMVDVPVSGKIQGSERKAELMIDVPYLQQGKNKLVHDTRVTASIDGVPGV